MTDYRYLRLLVALVLGPVLGGSAAESAFGQGVDVTIRAGSRPSSLSETALDFKRVMDGLAGVAKSVEASAPLTPGILTHLGAQGAPGLVQTAVMTHAQGLTARLNELRIPTHESEIEALVNGADGALSVRSATRHDAFGRLMGGLRSLEQKRRDTERTRSLLRDAQRSVDVARRASAVFEAAAGRALGIPLLGAREVAANAFWLFAAALPGELNRAEWAIERKDREIRAFQGGFQSAGFRNLLGNLRTYLELDRRAIVEGDAADAAAEALSRNMEWSSELARLSADLTGAASDEGPAGLQALRSARQYNARARVSPNQAPTDGAGLDRPLLEDVVRMTSDLDFVPESRDSIPYGFTQSELEARSAHQSRLQAQNGAIIEDQLASQRARQEFDDKFDTPRWPTTREPDEQPPPPPRWPNEQPPPPYDPRSGPPDEEMPPRRDRPDVPPPPEVVLPPRR